MTIQDQSNARGFETMPIIRDRITISSLQEAPGIRQTFKCVHIRKCLCVSAQTVHLYILDRFDDHNDETLYSVTKSKEDEMFENLSSAPIVYIYEDPQ